MKKLTAWKIFTITTLAAITLLPIQTHAQITRTAHKGKTESYKVYNASERTQRQSESHCTGYDG